ncbi:MAG: roadblock/LC7 domain-containing protein [Bacteroidetes bacterium]|nr:roadblock/LC7 domain-containing protein [Bacteroidota bacterium]
MAKSGNEDFRQVYLSENQMDLATNVLKDLFTKTAATAILLGDMTGQLLTKIGGLLDRDLEVFSVLAASNFTATSEMARLIGEKASFEVLFHEGEERSIYLMSIDDRYILEIIFKTTIPPGTVRIYAKKAKESLRQIILAESMMVDISEIFDDNFSSLLDEQFDKTMNQKDQKK